MIMDMPFLDQRCTENVEVGIGPLIISSILKHQKHEVIFYDNPIKNLQVDKKIIRQWVENVEPDIVCFSTRCDSYALSLIIAEQIKSVNPQIVIIFAGAQATHTDIDTIKEFPQVDIIIRGEGELTTEKLYPLISEHKYWGNIEGITYKDAKGNVIKNKESKLIDNWMYTPAYEQLPSNYLNNIQRMTSFRIEGGRGCPYNCIFCSTCNMWRRKYRIKTAAEIYKEMELVNKEYGLEEFIIEHDSLTANKKKFTEFLSDLKSRNKKKFRWKCSSRIDTLPIELLPEMKQAGCTSIYLGIETGSPKMQKIYGKNLNLDTLPKVLSELEKNDIGFTASFICGHPEEDINDIKKTTDLLIYCASKKNCKEVQLHKLSPISGSKLYEIYKNDLIFISNNISDQAVKIDTNEERLLIEKHPNIFSAFYSFNLEENLNNELAFLTTNGLKLMQNYPKTILYISKCLKLEIIDILKIMDNVTNIKGAISGFGKEMEKSCYKIMYNLFEFENYLFKLRTIQQGETPCNEGIRNKRYNFLLNPTLRCFEMLINPWNFENVTETNKTTTIIVWKNLHLQQIKMKELTEEDKFYLKVLQNGGENLVFHKVIEYLQTENILLKKDQ